MCEGYPSLPSRRSFDRSELDSNFLRHEKDHCSQYVTGQLRMKWISAAIFTNRNKTEFYLQIGDVLDRHLGHFRQYLIIYLNNSKTLPENGDTDRKLTFVAYDWQGLE